MQWQKTLLLFLLLNAPALAGTLRLKTRTVETSRQAEDFRAAPQKQWRTGVTHYLLQFQAPMNEQDRQALAERGAVISSALPDNGVIVAAGHDFITEGLALEYAGRLRGEDKVSPLLLSAKRPIPVLVEFHPDVEPEEARQLLQESGLTILPHPDIAPYHFLVTGPKQIITDLSQWDEVAYLFPASPELVSGGRVYHCGGASLATEQMIGQYVVASQGWSPDKSGSVTLGYYFSTLTPKVATQTAKTELVNALTEWTKVAKVQFQQANSATALRTINFLFASGDHGDGFPFDGPGTVLGHTFYPSNAEPIAGDMHLDADENWHAGGDIDIYTVALHEAGHALGLGHSDQPGAVMYPYYRRGATLSGDDIAAVQQIYGAPNSGSATQTTSVNPLSITIQTPTSNASTTVATVTVSGTTANGNGMKTITWQTDHSASGVATGSSDWSVASIPLIVGTNTITVTATDGSHTTATQSVVVTRTASVTSSNPVAPVTPPTATDRVAPVITIRSPQATITQTTSATITISGSATDNVRITKVTWENGVLGTSAATGTSVWSARVPLLSGTNNLVLRAYDAAGNTSWRTLTVIRR